MKLRQGFFSSASTIGGHYWRKGFHFHSSVCLSCKSPRALDETNCLFFLFARVQCCVMKFVVDETLLFCFLLLLFHGILIYYNTCCTHYHRVSVVSMSTLLLCEPLHSLQFRTSTQAQRVRRTRALLSTFYCTLYPGRRTDRPKPKQTRPLFTLSFLIQSLHNKWH